LSKTITISDEAYERLSKSKKRGESFTEVILREVPPKGKARDIMDLAGSWEGDEEEYQRIIAHIAERRSRPARKVEM
jgi:predicted CopG family antitoxin